jgi:uncharacterized protein
LLAFLCIHLHKKTCGDHWILKEERDEGNAILDFINTAFIPNGIFSIIDNECNLRSLEEYALFQNKSLLDRNDDEFVLICKDFTCSPPIKDIEGIKDILFSKLSKERIK